MTDVEKIKYLKIIKAHQNIIKHYGETARYLSTTFLIGKTIESLKKQNVTISRRTFYRAVNKAKDLKKDEFMLG